MQFDHIGIVTPEEKANETFVPATRVWRTDSQMHPFHVEWLRYEPDSPVTGPVREMPHVAYRVDDIQAAAKGMKVLLEPFDVGPRIVGFYQTPDGAVVEFVKEKGVRTLLSERPVGCFAQKGPDPSFVEKVLRGGIAIPAHPLALSAARKLDERHQRALSRYYIASGAGGLAVGVHTTQFAIREPRHGLYEPVLALAAEEMDRADPGRAEPLVRIAGVVGPTRQAAAEAETARRLGYHAALLSLAALAEASEDEVIEHCRAVAEVIPLFGFYLQPAVGGRVLGYSFWRRFAEIENVVAIKIAPFNRYRTIDVVRAIVESGRDDIALYTGNDDNIVMDLLTPFEFDIGGPSFPMRHSATRRLVGGLLGHWAVWTSKAVEILKQSQAAASSGEPVSTELLRLSVEVTDCNAAVFDAANGFAGVLAGVHEVLRRQGLLEGIWCLDPKETLSPGQAEQIDRVCRAYPHLTDDKFVAEHLGEWLGG